LLRLGWSIGALATVFMAAAGSITPFVIGMTLYGLTMFVLAPLNSYVTAARGRWSTGRAITFVSAAFNLGASLGPLVGGWIGQTWGFRSIFVYGAALFALSNGIILLVRAQPVEAAPGRGRLRALLTNRRYLVFLGLFFLVILTTFLPQPLSPNYLQNQQGLSLIQVGQLYSIFGVGIVALSLALGQLETRLGFLLGIVAVGVFAIALGRGAGLPVFALGYFLLGGFRVSRMMAMAEIREMVSPANMGLAYGAAETVSGAATILAPGLAALIYAARPAAVYDASLIGIVLVLILTSVFLYSRRPAAAPGPSLSEEVDHG
jgi:MFS family permease